jgi:hypothetical protein
MESWLGHKYPGEVLKVRFGSCSRSAGNNAVENIGVIPGTGRLPGIGSGPR